MTICQSCLFGIYWACCLGLCSWFWNSFKASWHLQMRDWDVKTTSIGLGVFPWWRIMFLWFHNEQKMVKQDWRNVILLCSIGKPGGKHPAIHCLKETLDKSELLTSRLEPCQIALASGQWRNKWFMVSSFSSHMRHLVGAANHLLFKIVNIGRLSCSIFQMKLRIFMGSFTFQIIFQTY